MTPMTEEKNQTPTPEPAQETKQPESSPTAERFRSLLNEMEKKYEFFDLNAAAAYMGMNPSYFSRLFHKQTRMTFSHYLNFIKVQKAVTSKELYPSSFSVVPLM